MGSLYDLFVSWEVLLHNIVSVIPVNKTTINSQLSSRGWCLQGRHFPPMQQIFSGILTRDYFAKSLVKLPRGHEAAAITFRVIKLTTAIIRFRCHI